MLIRAQQYLIPLLLLASPAEAQQAYCKPLPMMLLELSAKASETPIMRGMLDEQHYLILTANPQKDTFSVLIVNPQGIACMSYAGSDMQWEYYKPPRFPT